MVHFFKMTFFPSSFSSIQTGFGLTCFFFFPYPFAYCTAKQVRVKNSRYDNRSRGQSDTGPGAMECKQPGEAGMSEDTGSPWASRKEGTPADTSILAHKPHFRIPVPKTIR